MATRTKGAIVFRSTVLMTSSTPLTPYPTVNKTNTTSGSDIIDIGYGAPIDDEDEFSSMHDWSVAHKSVMIMLMISVGMAIILSVVAIFLQLTLLNKKLRTNPPMWYLYHLIPCCILTGLVLHPMTFFKVIYISRGACFFVMYLAEYVFFALGIHIVLFNIEIYFTKVLPLPQWKSAPFYRFVIVTVSGWLVAVLLVAHVVIDNNERLKVFCLVIPDDTARLWRVLLRELFPAIFSFLVMLVTLATYCLKRTRMSPRWRSGELRDVSSEVNVDEFQWLSSLIYIDITWMVRAICMTITHKYRIETPAGLYFIGTMMKLHTLALYLLPFAVLFIADVRETLKTHTCKIIRVLSLGRLRFGDDTQRLAVSFGNINATTDTT